jgi:hypothetical protein
MRTPQSDRNENGSPCYETFAGPDEAERDYDIVTLTPAALVFMAAEEEAEEAEMLALCPERYRIISEASGTLGEMSDAIHTHVLTCSRCHAPELPARKPIERMQGAFEFLKRTA